MDYIVAAILAIILLLMGAGMIVFVASFWELITRR